MATLTNVSNPTTSTVLKVADFGRPITGPVSLSTSSMVKPISVTKWNKLWIPKIPILFPIKAGDKRIGNGVIVPHAYYKIVINNQTRQIAGWLFPHVEPYPNLGNDLTKFRFPISQLEQQAGVKFNYPPSAIELQPGQEWPVNFGQLTASKKQKCGASASDD